MTRSSDSFAPGPWERVRRQLNSTRSGKPFQEIEDSAAKARRTGSPPDSASESSVPTLQGEASVIASAFVMRGQHWCTGGARAGKARKEIPSHASPSTPIHASPPIGTNAASTIAPSLHRFIASSLHLCTAESLNRSIAQSTHRPTNRSRLRTIKVGTMSPFDPRPFPSHWLELVTAACILGNPTCLPTPSIFPL